MSVSIGLLGEGFSIVAADNRATHLEPINGEKYSDNCEKMFQTKFGWVAVSGGVHASTTMFDNLLNSNEIKTRHQIYTCWLMSIKETERLAKIYFEDACNESNSSQAIYSLNYFKDGTLHMGVEFLDFAYKQRKLKEKNILIVNPPKSTKRIKRLIAKYVERVKNVKDINESVYHIACLVDKMAEITDRISNNVHCGISLKISDGEVLLMKVTENAKKIKQLYQEQKDLSSIMFVMDEIKEG